MMKKFKYLLLIMFATFISVSSVNAEIPTGEQYSEFANNKTVLLGLYTSSGEVNLYAYTPRLNEFLNGSLSLVRYENSTNDVYSNWAIRIYQSARGSGNYTMNWVTDWVSSSDAKSFCAFSSKPIPKGGETNSTVCSVVGNTAYLSVNYKLNVADTGTAYVDFELVSGGISLNWFLRLATAVYYPQIIQSSYIDTETLTQQQQTIINQNQQQINQNNTIINQQQQTNEKLDGLKEEIDNKTKEQIESQQVCNFIDRNNIKEDNKAIGVTGDTFESSNTGVTDYIKIISSKIIVKEIGGSGFRLAFYDTNKKYLSYVSNNDLIQNQEITIPVNAEYVRFTINKTSNKPQFEICTNGNQALNNSITSSDISSSQGQANSFFEGFESDDYGLSDIITMPLDLIKGLTSNTCVALNLTIPFVNKTFQLPCMSSIYQQYFGDFFTLYQTITFGFIAYWVIVKIFALVKGFKDPNDDKVEVLDL